MGLRRERRGEVAILTIDRPEARNAIDPEVTAQIESALDELESDDSASVVVVTGTGEEAFCSGVDLKVQAAEGLEGVLTEKGGFAGLIRRKFPKPLIAAVNGYALGGGFEIALACDIIVAAQHATFASTEVKWGLLADGGGLIRLPNRIPVAIAAELALTGDRISADRAAALGLVNRVVPPDRLLDETVAIGQTIAANSPRAVVLSKALLYEALGRHESEAWELNDAISRRMEETPDWVEGPEAFVAKRPPRWAT